MNDGFDSIVDAAMNEQVAVERLVSSIRNDIADLMAIRVNPHTAHLLVAEQQNIGSALTALQVLLSHVAGSAPALRIVR